MNKADIIEKIAEVADCSKNRANDVLDAILNGITNSLKNDEPVALLGFGTFNVKERPARKGRNPRTGEEITIKAAKVPSFKAGKALKEALQKEEA